MNAHIAILDIGKTNKKLLVFDTLYRVVYEHSAVLEETIDEDGFVCEDVYALAAWCQEQIMYILKQPDYNVVALNFAAYGASFVYIDELGEPLTPLYNYLKPLEATVQSTFYKMYGTSRRLSLETCSPALGLLNSGLQFFRIKQIAPDRYGQIKYALHLPQYLSYLFSQIALTEKTSIGCHTMLWDFTSDQYHPWVVREGLHQKFAPMQSPQSTILQHFDNKQIQVGTGLHDSSAALIPYLQAITTPFILLSTGTWSIALNPFNSIPLTDEELHQDCLCYLSYLGHPVKASRLFLGFELQEQLELLSIHFGKAELYFLNLAYDPTYLSYASLASDFAYMGPQGLRRSGFEKRNWAEIDDPDIAYHVLIYDLVRLQKKSIQLIEDQTIKELYVDGGFSKNRAFMVMLATAFPAWRVHAATVAQASALGAALAIHQEWNKSAIPEDLIQKTLITI